MNDDKLVGTAQDVAGKVKETVGDFTGDPSLKADGLADQLSGKAQKIVGSVKDAIDGGPTLDDLKIFARNRPYMTMAAIGVFGIALFNTLRRKK